MSISKHRTSFALDEATVERLKRLAGRWGVSQAEVVRRAVRIAAERSDEKAASVHERLQSYQASRRIDPERADVFLKQVNNDRARWSRDR